MRRWIIRSHFSEQASCITKIPRLSTSSTTVQMHMYHPKEYTNRHQESIHLQEYFHFLINPLPKQSDREVTAKRRCSTSREDCLISAISLHLGIHREERYHIISGTFSTIIIQRIEYTSPCSRQLNNSMHGYSAAVTNKGHQNSAYK